MNTTRKFWHTAIAIVIAIVALSACDYLGLTKAKLVLAQKTVAPGTPIVVAFTAPSSFKPNAWIGIIPSTTPHGSEATNDQFDISYQYLNKATSGSLTFAAPMQPGTYDLRLHDTDDNGKEVASVTFTVAGAPTAAATPTAGSASALTITSGVFKQGDQIKVTFTAPTTYKANAWVGIIPSRVTHGDESINDANDLTYQYLNGRASGELTFAAPSPGEYDLRMHDTDDNGKEVASVSFVVK